MFGPDYSKEPARGAPTSRTSSAVRRCT
jgi:hypothetical protein